MGVRNVDVNLVRNAVADLCVRANVLAPEEIVCAFKSAMKKEKSVSGKDAFRTLLENIKAAAREEIPICQDTGMATVYLEIGQDVHFTGGGLNDAVNRGVREGYEKGFLRKSVVDPLTRINTKDNTPAVIHTEIVHGEKIKITVSPKGFGSENMSAVRMFNPTDGLQKIEEFVVDVVKKAGARPCPPIFIGVGIGGTLDKAASIAKKALLYPLGKKNPDKMLAGFEDSCLKSVNRLGIGPQGLGGTVTAIAVKALKYPTHIAGLPVAVSICCHVLRHRTKII